MADTKSTIWATFAVAAALMTCGTAQANATVEIVADPSIVTAGSGAQVRTSAVQGEVRISGTQGFVRNTIKAVPGVKAHAMPTPNTCNGELSYTCD